MPVLLFALAASVGRGGGNPLEPARPRGRPLSVSTSIEQTAQGTREKPPKNGRARAVALPAFLVEELRHYRLRQAEELLRLGVRQTDDTHVCLREEAPRGPRGY